MLSIKWKKENGVEGSLDGDNDLHETVEIARAIYESDYDIEYVCVMEDGKVIKEWVW